MQIFLPGSDVVLVKSRTHRKTVEKVEITSNQRVVYHLFWWSDSDTRKTAVVTEAEVGRPSETSPTAIGFR